MRKGECSMGRAVHVLAAGCAAARLFETAANSSRVLTLRKAVERPFAGGYRDKRVSAMRPWPLLLDLTRDRYGLYYTLDELGRPIIVSRASAAVRGRN